MAGYDITPPNRQPNSAPHLMRLRLNHGAFGIVKEGGELLRVVERLIYYGKPYSDEELRAAVADEVGDVMWYVALTLNAVGLRLSDVMEGNVRKLVVRYPEKYTDHHAADENRDRQAEARAVLQPLNDPGMGEEFLRTLVTDPNV